MSYYTIEGHERDVCIRTLRYAKMWVLKQDYKTKISLNGKHIIRYTDNGIEETRTEIKVRIKGGYPTFGQPIQKL